MRSAHVAVFTRKGCTGAVLRVRALATPAGINAKALLSFTSGGYRRNAPRGVQDRVCYSEAMKGKNTISTLELFELFPNQEAPPCERGLLRHVRNAISNTRSSP